MGYSKNLLKVWIDFNLIPDIETTGKHMIALRKFCLTENIGSSLALRNKRTIQPDILEIMKKYDNISFYLEKIKELEFSYKYANIRDDIALNLMLNIVNNKKIVEEVFKGESSDKIISYIEYLIDSKTSSVLGNIKFK